MRSIVIQVDSDYRLESDSTCWTLIYDKIVGKDPKTGKDKRRYEAWYYSNLEIALRAYRDTIIRESGDKPTSITVDQMLERINESDQMIRKALEKLVGLPDERILDKPMVKHKRNKPKEIITDEESGSVVSTSV